MNMLKQSYKIILVSYIMMLLLLQPGTIFIYNILQLFKQQDSSSLQLAALSIWYSFSFFTTLLISLYALRDELQHDRIKGISWIKMFLWSIVGVFLALVAQSIAIRIELLFGIEAGSDNTETILSLIEKAPILFFVTAFIGPILEEIVFRKIVFAILIHKYNVYISAFISSLIFSLAHLEFEHILLYLAVGLVFSYLYYKTKRIVVPIFSHILMNTSVIVLSLI